MVAGMLFNTVRNFEKFKFEIIIGVCVFFILIYALYRKISGKKGTWMSVGNSRYIDTAKNILRADALNRMEIPSAGSFQNNSVDYTFNRESKGEAECRRAIEALLKRPFEKMRPDFLRNEVTGGVYNMELDCYNPELKLAVEYNGQQHYKFIPYFHRNKDRFINQRYRDVLKRKLCEENGVTLIEVPYTVPVRDIENFLRERIRGYINHR